MFDKFLDYLSGVRAELKEVKWPSTGQTIGYTTLVIMISLAVAFLTGGLDYLFTLLAEKLINIVIKLVNYFVFLFSIIPVFWRVL